MVRAQTREVQLAVCLAVHYLTFRSIFIYIYDAIHYLTFRTYFHIYIYEVISSGPELAPFSSCVGFRVYIYCLGCRV